MGKWVIVTTLRCRSRFEWSACVDFHCRRRRCCPAEQKNQTCVRQFSVWPPCAVRSALPDPLFPMISPVIPFTELTDPMAELNIGAPTPTAGGAIIHGSGAIIHGR